MIQMQNDFSIVVVFPCICITGHCKWSREECDNRKLHIKLQVGFFTFIFWQKTKPTEYFR